jgi:hypothetical protein
MRYLMIADVDESSNEGICHYIPVEGTEVDIIKLGNHEYCIKLITATRTYVIFEKITLKSPQICMNRLAALPDRSMEFPSAIFR